MSYPHFSGLGTGDINGMSYTNSSGIIPITANYANIEGIPPLTITDASNAKVKGIRLYGNTIDGVGTGNYNPATGLYAVPVHITGKNLFHPTQGAVNAFGITLTIVGDEITLNGTVTGGWINFKLTNGLKGTANEIIKSEPQFFNERIGFCDKGRYTIKRHYISGSVTTDFFSSAYTLPAVRIYMPNGNLSLENDKLYPEGLSFTGNPAFVAISLEGSIRNTTFNNYKFKIMLCKGTNASVFEQHHCSEFNIYSPYPCHIGDCITVNPYSHTAYFNSKNISSLQQWSSISKLVEGTNVISSSCTPPLSNMIVSYIRQ